MLHATLPMTLAEALILVSPWKPVVLLVPLVGWAWFVSKVCDKHAARFNLPREGFGLMHACMGLAAVLVAVAIPMKGEIAFWLGLLAMIAILAIDTAIYIVMANKDARVPEAHRIRLDFSSFQQARAEKAARKKQGQVELVLRASDKSVLPPPNTDDPAFEVRVAAEALFLKAIEARGSQIEIAPAGKDNAYAAAITVDGVRTVSDTMPAAEALKVIDVWKQAGKLDLAERRKRLQADITVERGETKRKARLVTIGIAGGHVRASILIDPEQQVRRKFDALGLLEPPQATDLKALIASGKGLVLLAAPSDMGRTTTFYTVMKQHDAYTNNVQTLEIDIQDSLEGVRQNAWEAQNEGPDFGTTTRSILRRDPQVLGIAELPDANTAKEAAKGDWERCRVYLCVRAPSALDAIQGFVKLVGDPELAAKGLQGVVANKLVRKLCETCRAPYAPTPDMLKKLGLPADKVKQLYKKSGQVIVKDKPQTCGVCGGTGYLGQSGCFEVYTLGDAERSAIKAGDWNGLKAELRKKNTPSIQAAALRKAVDGITSIEEIIRITSDAEAPKPAPAAPTAATTAPTAAAAPAKAPPAKPS